MTNGFMKKMFIDEVKGALRKERYIANTPLYRFAVISDVHVYLPESDWGDAAKDIERLFSQARNEGIDFIACCGDLTYNNTTEELDNLKTSISKFNTTSIPFYSCKGNHDCMNVSLDDTSWKKYVGHPRNFVIHKQSDVFIFVSQDFDSPSTGFTSETLTWFTNQLETYKNNRCFVFIHYPFTDTCGNTNDLYTGKLLSKTEDNGSVLWTLAQQYPNTIWFSGHTHLQLSLNNIDSEANIYWRPQTAKLVHVPSLATPRGDDDGDGVINAYNANSECYFIDVYADHIVIRGRDVINNKYYDTIQYILPTESSGASIPVITEKVVYKLNPANCTPYNNAAIQNDVITFNAVSDGIKQYTDIGIPENSKLYAKCDGITLSTGDTDLSKLTFTFTFYTDSTKSTTLGMLTTYNCYLDETQLVCSNGYVPDDTCKYVQIVFKSSSSYGGTLPVDITIDNFRLYTK